MHRKILTYCLFVIGALAMSNGAVIAAFSDAIPSVGPSILLASLPMAGLMLMAAWVNYSLLIPRLFTRGKYLPYLVVCFILAMAIPLIGIAMECGVRHWLSLPDRIHNYLSPWILIDSLSTASLLMVVMVAMGVGRIYTLWKQETSREQTIAKQYAKAIESMNKSIPATEVAKRLSQIKLLIDVNPVEADRSLRNLSETLRRDLYDLPKIPSVDNQSKQIAPKLVEFISGKRFTLLRDLMLKLLIACVSVTAIFEASDAPNLTLDGLWAFIGMFAIVSLVTYGNKSLCKYFLNKGKIRSYIAGCVIFLIIITLITIVVEYYSYVHTIYNGAPSLMYTLLATLSSFCTLALYLGGITALIVLHNWLQTVRKVAALRAESAKAEFNFLQSQINPHFLFNVINNTSILIHEAPKQASEMVAQLIRMFEYQKRLTDCRIVMLSEEVEFLRNYLLLEQSRKDPFQFEIQFESPDIQIPTLLFIPFVENASKHSSGNRDIRISFSIENSNLIFVCSNLCSDKPSEKKSGGLGIDNTRRRLQLLYGDDFNLSITRKSDRYTVVLTIPVSTPNS